MPTKAFMAILDVTTFPSKCKDSRRAKPSKNGNSEMSLAQSQTIGVCHSNAKTMAKLILHNMTVPPNVITYTLVMDAYAKQSKTGLQAAKHVECILFKLLDWTEWNEWQWHMIHPTATVVKAKDEVIMEQQQWHSAVTAVTCDVVPHAWAQQGMWQGATCTQAILDQRQVIGVDDMDMDKYGTSKCQVNCFITEYVAEELQIWTQETMRRHRPLLVCTTVTRLILTWEKMALLTASISFPKICLEQKQVSVVVASMICTPTRWCC